MIRDTLSQYNTDEMKALYVSTLIMQENRSFQKLEVKTGEADAFMGTRKEQRKYGSHSWEVHMTTLTLTLPPTWYNDIHLMGLSKLVYYGKITLALEATEIPIDTIKKAQQYDGLTLYTVKLPVFSSVKTMVTTSSGYRYPTSMPKMDVEERFMAVTMLGEESLAYAGKTAGIAAGNLRKNMLSEMKRLMGV